MSRKEEGGNSWLVFSGRSLVTVIGERGRGGEGGSVMEVLMVEVMVLMVEVVLGIHA